MNPVGNKLSIYMYNFVTDEKTKPYDIVYAILAPKLKHESCHKLNSVMQNSCMPHDH